MNIEKIEGLVAAPFTPMNQDGSLNLKIINQYSEKLKTDKLKGVFVCGTTGEGMLMTNRERRAVAEEWIQHQTKDFKVIVHVGTTSLKQSKKLAIHAQKDEAYAIGCMGPSFLRPEKVEELVDFCTEVAAGAPDLPFYYYHIPSVSGITLSMKEFIQQASLRIPNFVGLKFTHNDFVELQQCYELDNGKWDILHGFDELLLAGLAFGSKGAVGSTYNFWAPLYYSIIESFEKGDIEEARKKQLLSVRLINIFNKYGGPTVAGKALMKLFDLDCGPCRLPLKNMDESKYKSFTKEVLDLFSQLSDFNIVLVN